MEWFILIVVLPLILIPIVLLGGFAGCGELLPSSTDPVKPPADPTNLRGKALNPTSIELEWDDNSAGSAKFEIDRETLGANPKKETLPGLQKATPPPFIDASVAPSTTYVYVVRAKDPATGLPANNPTNSVTIATPPDVSLPPPPPLPIWQTAYDTPLTTNDADLKNNTLVQRLTALTAGGEQVRLTLRGTTTIGLAIDRLYVGDIGAPEPGNPIPDEWDSLSATLRELRPGGVYIPAGKPVTIDPVNFHVDMATGLAFAFDLNAALGQTKKANVAGQKAFHKAAALEANVANRTAGYTQLNGVYVVEKVEVFPSPAAIAPPVTWKPCVGTTFNADSITLGNATIVQRINSALLANGSTGKVRLTIQSSATGLVIRRMFISAAAVAGEPGNPVPNPWDSAAATIKEVRPGGASIPVNTPITIVFDYLLDKTKDLIIAFDIAEVSGTVCRQRNITGPSYYYLGNSEEATTANRSAGYTQVTNTICIVEKIEVA